MPTSGSSQPPITQSTGHLKQSSGFWGICIHVHIPTERHPCIQMIKNKSKSLLKLHGQCEGNEKKIISRVQVSESFLWAIVPVLLLSCLLSLFRDISIKRWWYTKKRPHHFHRSVTTTIFLYLEIFHILGKKDRVGNLDVRKSWISVILW